MRRMEFLKLFGIGALAVAAEGLSVACKSSSTPSNPTDSKVFTSATVNSHSHNITIQKSEVETPPAAGIARDTSSAGHTHTFAMSQADLATVKNGGPGNVVTGDTESHHHTFTIQKWY